MSDQGVTAPIPHGYRVIPVRVDLDTVIGLIQPGDLVDVMVFLRQGPDIPRTSTYTILRMARVYAVNTQTDRATEQKGQDSAAKTVSLLVKPKQAERLTLATEMGKIRLALRRPTDEVPDDEEVARDLPAIFRDGEALAVDKPEKKPDPQPETQVAVPVPQVAVVTPTAAPVGPVWTMRVMSPSEIKQFDWSSEADLPEEAPVGSTKGPSSPQPPQVDPVSASDTPAAEADVE
jgi:pilus assembly protein CpaB